MLLVKQSQPLGHGIIALLSFMNWECNNVKEENGFIKTLLEGKCVCLCVWGGHHDITIMERLLPDVGDHSVECELQK